MSILKQLWKLAKLGFVEERKKTLKESIRTSIKLLLFLMFLKILHVTLAKLINGPIVSQEFEMDTYSGIYQFFILAFFTPIFEELTFRLALKFTKWNFIIMSAGFTFLVLKMLFELDWTASLLSAVVIKSPAYY